MTQKLSIEQINKLSGEKFMEIFSNVIENYRPACESVVKQLCSSFNGVEELIEKFIEYLNQCNANEKEHILRLHPDLAGRLADAGQLTVESAMEQSTAKLNQISMEQKTELTKLNELYKQKFNFPFVICVRQNNKYEIILRQLKERLSNGIDEELQIGIDEVKSICRLRICEIIQQ